MYKVNRFGRIQKRLIIITISIILLLAILIMMMLQILRQNENVLNQFIQKDLKSLSQMVVIDNHASKISALAIELNQMGDFSGFRRRSADLEGEITDLKEINSQVDHSKINEVFISNLLEYSQNILKKGNKIIEHTADAQALLFQADTLLQDHLDDPSYPILSNIYNQLFALSNQNNEFALDFIKKQLDSIKGGSSEVKTELLLLFSEVIELYEKRIKDQNRLIFLSLYLGSQSNETAKASTQLLDDIWKNNREKAQAIVDNIHQKRSRFILTSIAIILAALLLLYLILGDLGRKIHQISAALLSLGKGEKIIINLPLHRKDEIGDLSRAYKIFESHLMDLARAGEQLLTQNRTMQTIFDTMRDGLSVFNAKGELISWNNKYTQLIGLEGQHIYLNMKLSEIEEKLQKIKVKNISNEGNDLDFNDILTERFQQNLSFEKHYPNGNIVELRSSPMEDGGFVTLYLDRTRRRALEQKYQQAQKLEAIGTITNGIAHDFNNFLAVIYGNVELLLEEDMEVELKEKLQQIKRISLSAQEVINRLLAFSRKENKVMTVFNVNKMLEDIYQIMDPLLKDSRIELSLELYKEPLFIQANMAEMESVILNLLSNSQKAIKEQGRIILKSSLKDNNVEISIQDNGIGMDDESLEHIFEPFFTRTINEKQAQGTGLGLSMVYGMIKRAKGEILISSQLSKGCLVTLVLPMVLGEYEEKIKPQDYIDHLSQKRILLVDDNHEVRNILGQQLRKWGHMVLDAQNGEKAIEYLNKSDDIDIVISDVMMPKKNGVELANFMNERYKKIPLILFSGNKDSLNMADGYNELNPKPPIIGKPWKMKEVQQLIEQLCSEDTLSDL